MKIKITQAGWAGFTGLLGHTLFEGGVSVEDLGKGDIQQIAACVTVEEFKDGKATGFNPSIAQVIIDTNLRPAEVVAFSAPAVATPVEAKVYTEAELHAVADAGGIKGIRTISDPMGLKGTSIAELVGKILATQAEAASKTAAAEAEAKAAEAKAAEPAAAAE